MQTTAGSTGIDLQNILVLLDLLFIFIFFTETKIQLRNFIQPESHAGTLSPYVGALRMNRKQSGQQLHCRAYLLPEHT